MSGLIPMVSSSPPPFEPDDNGDSWTHEEDDFGGFETAQDNFSADFSGEQFNGNTAKALSKEPVINNSNNDAAEHNNALKINGELSPPEVDSTTALQQDGSGNLENSTDGQTIDCDDDSKLENSGDNSTITDVTSSTDATEAIISETHNDNNRSQQEPTLEDISEALGTTDKVEEDSGYTPQFSAQEPQTEETAKDMDEDLQTETASAKERSKESPEPLDFKPSSFASSEEHKSDTVANNEVIDDVTTVEPASVDDWGDFGDTAAAADDAAADGEWSNFDNADPTAASDWSAFGNTTSETANPNADSNWAEDHQLGQTASVVRDDFDDFGDFEDVRKPEETEHVTSYDVVVGLLMTNWKGNWFSFQKSDTSKLSVLVQSTFLGVPLAEEDEEEPTPRSLEGHMTESRMRCREIQVQGELYGYKQMQTKTITEDISVWPNVNDVKVTNAIEFRWNLSSSRTCLLNALRIDPRNVLTSRKEHQHPPGLTDGVLQPVKGGDETKASEDATSPQQSEPQQQEVPEVEFDWKKSGLTNPLDSGGGVLDLDFFTKNTPFAVQAGSCSALENELLSSLEPNRSTEPPKSLPPLEAVLANMDYTPTTPRSAVTSRGLLPASALSAQTQKVVLGLPDLSFMHSHLLLFPLKQQPEQQVDEQVQQVITAGPYTGPDMF